MKLTHLTLLATLLSGAFAAVADDSVTLRITGVIMPVACSPEVSGQPQQPGLMVDCFLPRAVNIRWTEAGSNAPLSTTQLNAQLRQSPTATLKHNLSSVSHTALEIYYL